MQWHGMALKSSWKKVLQNTGLFLKVTFSVFMAVTRYDPSDDVHDDDEKV